MAGAEVIKAGRVTDVYFVNTMKVLGEAGIDLHVSMEVRAGSLPANGPFAVFAGLDDALTLLEGLPVDVRGLPEGALFSAGEPVLEVSGRYGAFGQLETSLLGFLCQASGVATAACRARLAAGRRTLLSFGARRMHPAVAPAIERAAVIGGCDGFSVVAAEEAVGFPATGTLPHALVLLVGDTLKTAQLFHQHLPPEVKRIILIDTFQDEKFETLRLAREMGADLFGVRFDTPASRRGDLAAILKETRWELALRGFKNVRFFASGGLDDEAILRLNSLCDGYGVGTFISNARTVDFSMDIVEIEGKAEAKRGKESGRKTIWTREGSVERRVLPAIDPSPGPGWIPLTTALMKKGIRTGPTPPVEIRRKVLEQLERPGGLQGEISIP
jgi:nicotinate phosphoribosyltransferase